MKVLRWLASLIICSAAAAAIWFYCIGPMRCEKMEFSVQRITERIAPYAADQIRVVPYARRNIQRLTPCMACASNVNRAMLLAANLRLIGRQEEAVAAYREALRRDRRPELYFNIGTTLLELGRDAEAREYLITACLYNPDYESAIPAHQDELRNAVDRYYLRIKEEAEKRSRR